MTEDFNIGQCSIFREGLMLIVKDAGTGNLLVMCDDCEAMWPSPEDALENRNQLPFNSIAKVVDPTYPEVKAAGWDKFMTVSPHWFDDSSAG